MTYTTQKTLELKWQISDQPHYKWSVCKRLINTKTSREIKKTINGGCIGYWIGRKFVSLTALRPKLTLIPRQESLPF